MTARVQRRTGKEFRTHKVEDFSLMSGERKQGRGTKNEEKQIRKKKSDKPEKEGEEKEDEIPRGEDMTGFGAGRK